MVRDVETEVAIRWGKEYEETLQIFYAGWDEVINSKDPRFAPLTAVLDWIPHDDVYGDRKREEVSYYIRWWNSISLDAIEHLVKKTEENEKDATETK